MTENCQKMDFTGVEIAWVEAKSNRFPKWFRLRVDIILKVSRNAIEIGNAWVCEILV